MMKLIASTVMLLCCTFFSDRVQEKTDAELVAKRQKAIEECELPERVKPEGDIKPVSQFCGKALSLPKPLYPDEAKAQKVAGTVVVDIVTNEDGWVIWAKVASGPELLRRVSEKAACRARYSPTMISGKAIQTQSSIQYQFVSP